MSKNRELITERNKDFVRAYRQACKENHCENIREYVRIAVKKPAPRFYIEKERAYDIIMFMEGNVAFVSQNPNKIRMYDEIYIRYKNLSELYPNKQKGDIIESVINQPAPEFYIGIHAAMKIINSNNTRARRLRHEKS